MVVGPRLATLSTKAATLLTLTPPPLSPPRAAAVFAGKLVSGQLDVENPFVLISSGLLVQPDEGVSDLVMDRIGVNYRNLPRRAGFLKQRLEPGTSASKVFNFEHPMNDDLLNCLFFVLIASRYLFLVLPLPSRGGGSGPQQDHVGKRVKVRLLSRRVSMTFRVVRTNQYNQDLGLIHSTNGNHLESPNEGSSIDHQFPCGNHESSTCVTLNGSGIQLAVGPQPLRLRNHNFGLTHRIMVKRLATSSHDPLGITDSACKNQLVVVSVQYGPFYTYIPIRSTTIGKSRVAIDPIAMHTSWRSNSDIRAVNPRQRSIDSYMHRDLTQSRRLMTPIQPRPRTYPSTNGNHLESPNEGSSIDHQVTIHLHAQNITMFPTNETWYFASQMLVSSSGGLILILTAQSTRNEFRMHSDY
ncbi:hypothetical protein F511_12318 [Dorcoceras hygrometricum]|uniref:Uncharacterized protein n=1 Tax=Dorcoceras hygrometricum TaxID=472368 RepID=A0A2Z7BNR4_9LAMI|nr:hypothetical protein F511_12318 [Dorcoceras hygrometricum]